MPSLASFLLIATLLSIALITHTNADAINNSPVIGILTTPSDIKNPFNPSQWSYLPGSYIKFIESAGGRVIPIPYDASQQNLTYFFNRINGLLLPGGGANLYIDNPDQNQRTYSPVTAAAAFLLDLAADANSKGNHFPVWATCQGYEIFLIWAAGVFAMDNVTDHNINRNMSFTYTIKNSPLWQNVSDDILQDMQNKALTYYNHQNIITPEKFYSISNMIMNYNIDGIAYGAMGRWYIAALEHKTYPFYANQFHPEKNVFEWQPKITASHAPEAVMMEQQLANFFVNECRLNFNKFNSYTALSASLIYNFGTYAPGPTHDFVTVYMFPMVADNQTFWKNIWNSSFIDTNATEYDTHYIY